VCKNAELLLFHVAFRFKSLECRIEHSLPFNIMGAVALKGIVYPKMKILLFTHPHVVPNLFVEHKTRYKMSHCFLFTQ